MPWLPAVDTLRATDRPSMLRSGCCETVEEELIADVTGNNAPMLHTLQQQDHVFD